MTQFLIGMGCGAILGAILLYLGLGAYYSWWK